MKKRYIDVGLILCISLLLILTQACGQVQTDSKSFPLNLIGEPYPAYADPQYLSDYESLGGSLITPVHLEENVIVSVYRKAQSYLLLFCHRASNLDSFYTVKQVLDIDSIPEGYFLVHGLCRIQKLDQPGVVAIMGPGEMYSSNILRAWLYDWVDDLLIEVDAKEVDCYNEYFDLTQIKFSFLNYT